MDVLKSVIESLQPAPKRIFIGVSGGLDSVVLLDQVAQFLKTHHKIEIIVLHVHHHIQTEADHWADFIEKLAAQYGFDFRICHLDPKIYQNGNTENAARSGRYAFFESQLIDADDYLFLAHHAQDQIETFFLNLQRGAGLTGLSAMPLIRPFGMGHLVRPLLIESRKNLENYAKQNQLKWVEDPSNQDVSFNRNFLRSEILPILRKRWPHFEMSVARSISHLQLIREIVEEYLSAELVVLANGAEFDLKALKQYAPERHKLLIQAWVKSNTGKTLNDKQLDIVVKEVIGASLDADPLFEIPGLRITRSGLKMRLEKNQA